MSFDKTAILAHFNPAELDALSYLQGEDEPVSTKNHKLAKRVRAFKGLERLLENSHVRRNIEDGIEAHAHGGMVGESQQQLDHMARQGIHGDTELGLIGPHTRGMLDRLIACERRSPSRNADGHPQYFSLGGMLGSIGNFLKVPAQALWNGAKKVLPAIPGVLGSIAETAAPLIGGAIGAGFGNPALGSQIGGFAGNLAGQLGRAFTPADRQQQAADIGSHVSNFGNQALNAYQQGGMRGAAQQMAGSALNMGGAAAQQFGVPSQITNPIQKYGRNMANPYAQMG